MTSELWIGVFIGGGIVTISVFMVVLMWAITARSSQISREEETLDHEKYFKDRPDDGLIGGSYIPGRDQKGQVDPRPEPPPPDYDVKSS